MNIDLHCSSLALSILLFAGMGGLFLPLSPVALTLLLYMFAFQTKPIAMDKVGDLSYGTYVFGTPVIQLYIHNVNGLTPYVLFAFAGPTAMVLAFCSWRFVEKPCLQWQRKPKAAPTLTPEYAS